MWCQKVGELLVGLVCVVTVILHWSDEELWNASILRQNMNSLVVQYPLCMTNVSECHLYIALCSYRLASLGNIIQAKLQNSRHSRMLNQNISIQLDQIPLAFYFFHFWVSM